jgi:hypothetical protein
MENTLNRVNKILKWYYLIPQDYADIDTLLYNRKQLSIESVKLALIVGEFKAEYDSTYFKRKVAFSKAFEQIKATSTEKITDSVAIHKANIEIEPIEDIEKSLSGQFEKGKMILKQVNEVLSSMQQQLSYLKKEKETVNIREK